LSQEAIAKTTIYGEASKLDAILKHLFAEDLFPVVPAFRLQPIGPKCPLVGGGTLTHFPLKHPGGSMGFRLDWSASAGSPGRSLAYVTDTTADPAADYVQQIRGVDLLVHEAFFQHDAHSWSDTIGHSCLEDVVQVAAKAKVGRLLLVHMSPQLMNDADFDLTAARRIFPATELGRDLLEVEF
jgi:ribonuclease BN (tRNA processing enzyme)